MSDKPTKASINAAISEVNGTLAWAREYVRNNDWVQARNQIVAAQVALALAKVRVEAREEAEGAEV